MTPSSAEDAVEGLVMSVLLRTRRLNKTDTDPSIPDPLLDLFRNKLWTVIALHSRRSAVKFNELIEHANQIVRREMTCALDAHSMRTKIIDAPQ